MALFGDEKSGARDLNSHSAYDGTTGGREDKRKNALQMLPGFFGKLFTEHAAKQGGDERFELILQTICGTGIHISELPFVTAEAVQRSEAIVSCKNKTRTVFLVRELRKKLLWYCRQNSITSGPVFVSKLGKPLNRTTVWRLMKGLCKRANVEPSKVFPHNLRHLFARVFYAIEKDIAKLADILGHSSIYTTRIYIISTGTEHRQRMEQMRLIL